MRNRNALQDKVMGNVNAKRMERGNGSTGTSNGLLTKGMLAEGHTEKASLWDEEASLTRSKKE